MLVLFLGMGFEPGCEREVPYPSEDVEELAERDMAQKDADQISVTLYYPARDLSGLLSVQLNVPDRRGELTQWLSTLVEALSTRPGQGAKEALVLFPPGTRPNHAFMDEKGTLFLDLPAEAVESSIAGVELEILTLNALLRSIGANVDGVKRVKILVAGKDREEYWGHVYVRQPLAIP